MYRRGLVKEQTGQNTEQLFADQVLKKIHNSAAQLKIIYLARNAIAEILTIYTSLKLY